MSTAHVKAFELAAGRFLIETNREAIPGSMFRYQPSKFQEHMQTCELQEVANLYQDVESVSVFDSFDSGRTSPVAIISANLTCACGEYSGHRVAHEGLFDDVLRHLVALSD